MIEPFRLIKSSLSSDGSLAWAVVGIGINVRAPRDGFPSELVDIAANQSAVISSSSKASASSLNVTTEEERVLIDKAAAISAAEWYALSKWAKETDNFQGWQRSIVFSVAQLIARNRKPSYKQAVQALKVYEEAVQKGFNKL